MYVPPFQNIIKNFAIDRFKNFFESLIDSFTWRIYIPGQFSSIINYIRCGCQCYCPSPQGRKDSVLLSGFLFGVLLELCGAVAVILLDYILKILAKLKHVYYREFRKQ